MTVYFEHYSSGKIFGIIYDFSEVGDGIGMHTHSEELLHNVVVLKGRIRLYGENDDGVKLEAGDIHDFDSTKMHEIVALEEDTKILNTFLNGIPVGYAELPDYEKVGVLERPLTRKLGLGE
jgi:quercetin dioxygenase-like cupin family protein